MPMWQKGEGEMASQRLFRGMVRDLRYLEIGFKEL